MPTFEVTSPDGAVYHIDGPEGSTEEDAIAQAQQQHSTTGIPSGATNIHPGMFYTDNKGQNHIPIVDESQNMIGDSLGEIPSVAQGIVGGARNLAVGAATAPLDIALSFNHDNHEPAANFIRNIRDTIQKGVPVVDQYDTPGEIIQAGVQYAPLAAGGAAEAGAIAKNLAPKLLEGEAPSFITKLMSVLSKGTGAAAGDAIAANPTQDSEDIGNMIGGPTEIQPQDNDLVKRLKIGAETGIGEGALSAIKGVAKTGKAIVNKGADIIGGIKNATQSPEEIEAAARQAAAEKLQANVVDKDAAIKNLEAAQTNLSTPDTVGENGEVTPGYKPTISSSKDPGLMALQQGLSSDLPIATRMTQNQNNTAEKLAQFAEPRGDQSSVDALKAQAEAAKNETVTPAAENAKNISDQLDAVKKQLDDLHETVRSQGGAANKDAASEQIHEQVRGAQKKLTQEKNAAYDAVDPNLSAGIDANDLVDKVKGIEDAAKTNRLADPKAFPTDLVERIKKLDPNYDPQAPKNGEETFDNSGFITASNGMKFSAPTAEGKVMVVYPNSKTPVPMNKSQADQIFKQLSPTGAGIPDSVPPVSSTVSLGELTSLKKSISDLKKPALGQPVPNGEALKHLNAIDDAVTEHIDKFRNLQPGDAAAEAGDRLKQADTINAQKFSPNVQKGVGGKIARDARTGKETPSKTAGAFLDKGQGAKERAADLNRIGDEVANPDVLNQSKRDYVVARLADEVFGKNGAHPATLDKWIANNRSMLEQNPEVLSEVQQLRNQVANGSKKVNDLGKAAQDASDNLKKTEGDFNRSGVGVYLNSDDPHALIGKAIRGRDIKTLGDLRDLAAKDTTGNATKGFQDMARQHLGDILTQSSQTPTGDELKASNAAFARFLSKGKGQKMLETVFTDPKDLQALRAVHAQVIDQSRFIKASPAADTKMLTDQGQAGKEMISEIANLASGGKAKRVGRLIEAVMAKAGIGNDPAVTEQIAKKVLHEMILNPDMARNALMIDLSKVESGTAGALAKKTTSGSDKGWTGIKTYITNNVIPSLNDKKDEQ